VLTANSLRHCYAAVSHFLRQEDKQQHLAISGLIVFFLAVIWSIGIAIAVAGVVGVAKEIWDHFYGSGFSVGDLIADAVGILGGGLAACSLVM